MTCRRCFGTGYIPSETCTDCVDCQDRCPECKGGEVIETADPRDVQQQIETGLRGGEAPPVEPPSDREFDALAAAVSSYLDHLHSEKPLNDDFRAIKARIVTLACILASRGPAQAQGWQPINVEQMRANLHATFNGGHHEEGGRRAFHHGMDTVCNVLDAHQNRQATNGILPAPPAAEGDARCCMVLARRRGRMALADSATEREWNRSASRLPRIAGCQPSRQMTDHNVIARAEQHVQALRACVRFTPGGGFTDASQWCLVCEGAKHDHVTRAVLEALLALLREQEQEMEKLEQEMRAEARTVRACSTRLVNWDVRARGYEKWADQLAALRAAEATEGGPR